MPLTRISSASWWRDYLHSWAIKFAPPYLSHLCPPDFDSSTSVPAGSQGKVCPSYQPEKNSCIQICYFCTHSNVRPIFIRHFCINSMSRRRQIWFVVCVWDKLWLTPPQKPRTPPLNISSFLKHRTRGEHFDCNCEMLRFFARNRFARVFLAPYIVDIVFSPHCPANDSWSWGKEGHQGYLLLPSKWLKGSTRNTRLPSMALNSSVYGHWPYF